MSDKNITVLTQKEESFFNLNNKPIQIKSNEWYNLETSRRLTKLTGRNYLEWPRIAGPTNMIVQFLKVNHIEISNVSVPSQLKLLYAEISNQIQAENPCILSHQNIDEVSEDEINRLVPFSFNYTDVDAKVTNIIDGDTIICVTIIDPVSLSLPMPIRIDKKTVIGNNCAVICSDVNSRPNSKLLVKLTIRIYGCDAADSDKQRKSAATQFTKDWCNKLNNKVMLRLRGYGKHSRVLADVYPRNNAKQSLTDDLLSYKHPSLGTVAKPYYGGSKSEAWAQT